MRFSTGVCSDSHTTQKNVMDRISLKRAFTRETVPPWLCPACGKGILQLKKDSFLQGERAHTRDHSHEFFEPEWIEYTYACLFECSNNHCKEIISSTGTGSVDWDVICGEDGEPEQNYKDYFRPKYFEPPLRIIDIPEPCPESVSTPIKESFRLLFVSPSAAANNIRIAIENLLTELKIKRFNLAKGKRQFVPLHFRITLIPEKYKDLKEMLLAIKWLGNSGSHDHDAMTIDDVFDAYELAEHVLKEIYEPKLHKLNALAKKVNKKKGPAK